MFADREDAGLRLAESVAQHGFQADLVVAIPRGGLVAGRAVADRLGVDLDVISARKLGAPSNPELAVGAVTADGTVWLNEQLIRDLGVDAAAIDVVIERERRTAQAALERYRGDRPAATVRGRTVLVVDDGVATGATAIVALRQLRQMGAKRVVLAIPVAPRETIERLQTEADEVICLNSPREFGSVGRHYESFQQVSDEKAIAYLRS